MDAELRNALDGIMGVASESARNSRAAVAKVDEIAVKVDRLERHVFGSTPPTDPPAPPGGTAPKVTPLTARVSTNENADQEFRARLERVEEMTKRQCAAMGVAQWKEEKPPTALESVFAFLRSREGANLLLRIVIGLVCAYGAKSAAEAHAAAERAERASEVVHVVPAPTVAPPAASK